MIHLKCILFAVFRHFFPRCFIPTFHRGGPRYDHCGRDKTSNTAPPVESRILPSTKLPLQHLSRLDSWGSLETGATVEGVPQLELRFQHRSAVAVGLVSLLVASPDETYALYLHKTGVLRLHPVLLHFVVRKLLVSSSSCRSVTPDYHLRWNWGVVAAPLPRLHSSLNPTKKCAVHIFAPTFSICERHIHSHDIPSPLITLPSSPTLQGHAG